VKASLECRRGRGGDGGDGVWVDDDHTSDPSGDQKKEGGEGDKGEAGKRRIVEVVTKSLKRSPQ